MDERDLEALRTRVANQAASLAEAVTQGFDGFRLGAGDYWVQLTSPEGPSTGGGMQARQHIRLVPRRKGYAIVVAGTVDPVTSTADVRTFDHVALLHELRFDRPIEITAEEWEAFLAKTDIVLGLARVRSRRVGPPPEAVAHARARRKISVPMLVIFLIVLGLATAVLYRVVLALRGH